MSKYSEQVNVGDSYKDMTLECYFCNAENTIKYNPRIHTEFFCHSCKQRTVVLVTIPEIDNK